tara:strand:+ start:2417 stop:2698 length:282 start_codon:yes stop_codon:yes gene_type:complete
MDTLSHHYNAYEEGIQRATLIKRDLLKHPTEYFPEKVRVLNKTYIATAKQIIHHGEEYLKECDKCLTKELQVAITVENYRAMLSSLPKQDETK